MINSQMRFKLLIALLVSIPYILLQAFFLYFSPGLAYLNMPLIYVMIIVISIVGLGVELWLRHNLPFVRFRCPSFSIIGICFILTIMHVGSWVHPLALRVPRWRHISQSIEWDVIEPSERDKRYKRFTLSLLGSGYLPDHKFTSAVLHWSGDIPKGGLPDINIEKMTLSYWQEYEQKVYPVTLNALRNRMLGTNIPDEQIDKISKDILSILQQIKEDKPINPLYGQVESIKQEGTFGEEIMLGGIMWMIALILAFQIVGFFTIPGEINGPDTIKK